MIIIMCNIYFTQIYYYVLEIQTPAEFFVRNP